MSELYPILRALKMGEGSGGGGGTSDYTQLSNKPQINSHELSGNKSSSDLGLQSDVMAGYTEPSETSAIAATDTVLAAMGKLERKADTNKNNILSLTPTAYSPISITSSASDLTIISGGYCKVGNVVVVNARITVGTAISPNTIIFQGLPKAVSTPDLASGTAICPVLAVSVTTNVSDTNLILFNYSTTDARISVAGNHNELAAGNYVISCIYLAQ